MIRPATVDDASSIVALAQRFIRETPYSAQMPENPQQLRAFVNLLLEHEDGELFVAERGGAVVGLIALWVFLHPYSGERMASELVWWVNPEQRGGSLGVRLLKRAEMWAREHGAAVLQMIAPNDKVAGFYQACGFAFVESSYARRLV